MPESHLCCGVPWGSCTGWVKAKGNQPILQQKKDFKKMQSYLDQRRFFSSKNCFLTSQPQANHIRDENFFHILVGVEVLSILPPFPPVPDQRDGVALCEWELSIGRRLVVVHSAHARSMLRGRVWYQYPLRRSNWNIKTMRAEFNNRFTVLRMEEFFRKSGSVGDLHICHSLDGSWVVVGRDTSSPIYYSLGGSSEVVGWDN